MRAADASVTDASVSRPLRGIRILERDDDLALAFCGKYLAALGATVQLESDRHLSQQSASVRAYVDDGKVPASGNDLSEDFDVELTVTDERVGVAPIRVVVTDSGETGPQRSWTNGELVAQASSGLLSLIGEPGRPPLQLGGHQIDYSVGLMAFSATLIAVTSRRLDPSQAGEEIRLSRLEAAAYIEWKGRVYAQAGNELTRGERSGPIVIRCQDGYFGFYYRATDWPRVLDIFDQPVLRAAPFDTHAGRIEHRTALAELLTELTSSMEVSELYDRMQAAGIPAGPVYDAAGLVTSAQYAHRRLLEPLRAGSSAGAVQPSIPVLFNGSRPNGERVDHV